MSRFRMPKNLGMVLLAIWLIMTGLITLFHISFDGLYVIMALLAVASGLFILLGH
jgi:hypothetical protein